ncbi:hypothetical protein vseg_012267 [Gypsophila vaccaria]
MDHFGTPNDLNTNAFYAANNTNANGYDNVGGQHGFTRPEIDLNVHHGCYTAMLLDDSPVRATPGDINLNLPYLDDPFLNLNNNTYDRSWLSLSLPEPSDLGGSDNLTRVEPNQISVASSDLNMDPHNNDRPFIQAETPPDVTPNAMLIDPVPVNNPVPINEPPRTTEVESRGRMIQDNTNNPVRLSPALNIRPPTIITPEFIAATGGALHSIENSRLFLQRLMIILLSNVYGVLTPGSAAWEEDETIRSIKSGDYLQVLMSDGRTGIWERDQFMSQIIELVGPDEEEELVAAAADEYDEDEEDDDDDDDGDDDYDYYSEYDHDEDVDTLYPVARPRVNNRRGTAPDDIAAVASEFDNLRYEDVVAMQDEIGYVPVGLPEERINEAVKKVHFLASDSTLISTSEPQCSICWDGYEDGQDIGVLRCEHEYHYECIKHWLGNKDSCPLCRRNVV